METERDASWFVEKSLELRRAEKNYILRIDKIYIDEVDSLINEILTRVEPAKLRLKSEDDKKIIDEIASQAKKYNEAFLKYIQFQEKQNQSRIDFLEKETFVIKTINEFIEEQRVNIDLLIRQNADINFISQEISIFDRMNSIRAEIDNIGKLERNYIITLQDGTKRQAYEAQLRNAFASVNNSVSEIKLVVERALTDRFDIDFTEVMKQVDLRLQALKVEEDAFEALAIIELDKDSQQLIMENVARDLIDTAQNLESVQRAERRSAHANAIRILWTSASLAFIIVVLLAYLITVGITTPISKLVKLANEVAGGDLTRKANINQRNEVGILVSAFNDTIDGLRDIVKNVLQAAGETLSSSQELSAASQQVAFTIQQVSVSTEEFASTIEQLGLNTQDMSDNVDEVNSLSQQGVGLMVNARKEMEEILKSSEEAKDTLGRFAKASERIDDIVKVISDVADQTQNSVNNIHDLIQRLTTETKETVASIEENNVQIQKGSKTLYQAGDAFDDITERIQGIVTQIQNVASASNEQSASTQQVSSSAEQLASMAQDLNALVAQLKV